MIQEEYIKYNTAILAREKGFTEICQYFYHGELTRNEILSDGLLHTNDKFKEKNETYYVTAPTQGHLQRWLREKCGILVYVEHSSGAWGPVIEYSRGYLEFPVTESYEQALEDGLVEALKLIK